MKLMIIGHGRHGKDTAAAMFEDMYGLKFTSSSWFCAEKVVFPALTSAEKRKELAEKYWHHIPEYASAGAAYEDRARYRTLWFNLIAEYNTPDPTRLGREILAQYDMYVGIRDPAEFHALRHIDAFDFAIWVDRSRRWTDEDKSSMGMAPWMADFVIDNNGTLDDLRANVRRLWDHKLRHLA